MRQFRECLKSTFFNTVEETQKAYCIKEVIQQDNTLLFVFDPSVHNAANRVSNYLIWCVTAARRNMLEEGHYTHFDAVPDERLPFVISKKSDSSITISGTNTELALHDLQNNGYIAKDIRIVDAKQIQEAFEH